MSNSINPRIIIVGAGFSGIGLAIKLQEAGFMNLRIFERGEGIGGTWWHNIYPGVTVDVPTVLYSYSFALKSDWSHKFAPGKEIQKYIEECADKFDVHKYIQFNRAVTKAIFQEATNEWEITTENGATHICDIFIRASGALIEPKLPDISGIKDFKGKVIHSAAWDSSYDFKGKTIAVIGTGASAVQIIPELAKTVKHLTIFQRSAPWIAPRQDFEQGNFRKYLYKYLPFTQRLMRFFTWSLYEYLITPLFLKKTKKGEILKNKLFLPQLIKHRTEVIKDPDLLKKVTPDYDLGCKRILVSDDYYPALCRSNVDLITDPIVKITGNSIVTQTGRIYELDALVLATGFDLLHNLVPWEMTGLRSVNVNEYFNSVGGPEAYKGIAISGFPNFFMTLGPNSAAGSMSTLYSIEVDIEYIVKALEYMRDNKIVYANVKKDVMDVFNYRLQNELAPGTVWMTGCHSWYKTDEGKLLAIWPASARAYAKELAKYVPADYDLKK